MTAKAYCVGCGERQTRKGVMPCRSCGKHTCPLCVSPPLLNGKIATRFLAQWVCYICVARADSGNGGLTGEK